MVYQLIYTSSATPSLDDFALREIAQSSSFNNQQIGVTGLLLFHEGSILQVLEGDKESVLSIYDIVKRDKRHAGCMVLSTRTAEHREFSDWFMGYKNISGRVGSEALFALNRTNLDSIMPKNPSPELGTLTQTFERVSGF